MVFLLRRKLVLIVSVTVLSGLIGYAYTYLVDGTLIVGVTIGAGIGGSLTALEHLYVQGPLGAPLRRSPLPVFIFLLSFIWVVVILFFLVTTPLFFPEDSYSYDGVNAVLLRDLAFAFTICLIINSFLRARSLIGPRVLSNFLLGRYYRPLREERVFMFLDIAGSTSLAETMGDLKVQSLIAEFFFDIAYPIAMHNGETHRYIGDEVVVVWPTESALEGGRCLKCVASIYETVSRHRAKYEKKYGVIPAFRIGLHGGPVVASEIGDDKREIVYFGDTINTTARLASMCKDVDASILISDSLLEQLPRIEGFRKVPLGPLAVRGKSQALSVTKLDYDGRSLV